MKYMATLKSTQTGKIINTPYFEYGDGSVFWWVEGNMSCDCNRESYFQEEEQAEKCGNNRFSLLALTMEDGSNIEIYNA